MNTQTNEFDVLTGIIDRDTVKKLNSWNFSIRPSTYKKIAKWLNKDFWPTSEITLSILKKIKPIKQ